MGFQVSPGVEVKEIDLTNVIPAVSTSIGAFAGHFSWGPVGEVGLVSSEKELIKEYGTPSSTADGGDYDNYTSFLQAASFLKYANTLRVSRAIAESATNAAGSVYGAATDVVKIDNEEVFDGLTNFGAIPGVIQARYPGALGNSLKAHIACAIYTPARPLNSPPIGLAGEFDDVNLDNSVNAVAGTSSWAAANVQAGANDEIHVIIVDEDGRFTGTKGAILEIFEGLSLYADATKEGGSNYYKTVINRDSDYVYINETAFAASFLSTVAGVARAVPGSLGSSGNIFSGNLIAAGSIATIGTPALSDADSEADLIAGTYTVTDGVTENMDNSGSSGSGAKFEIVISGGSGSNFTATATVIDGGGGYAVNDTIDVPYEALGAADDSPSSGDLTITVATVDSSDLFGYSLTGGTDGSTAALAGGKADVPTALAYFANPAEIDINLVFAEVDADGANLIGNKIVEICGTTRKDCVGFISPDPTANTAGAVTADLDYNNSYVVLDSSAVYVYNKYTDSYRYIPANGHVAGLCARTDDTNDPWFSPAGYNRGNLLGVTKLKWNPNKAERDVLYKAGVNPIISEPGQGILLFGDKTAQKKPSAFDRINVRRLFIVLEKAVSTASKFQLFELNDEFTRAMFRNMTEPFLRDVKGRRGITDFLVVCDETNNTGDIIDTNRFVADIYIKPARSINFITLNFVATRTGVEFSEIVGTGN